ncbi:MAG: stearoyl-CoA 9-desaturase [Verrucomicrobiaceae bacterium]|nr:MAG: stearoyl-CoA 9-desaturase [Verrucomicrobiaceae bacterium]
MVVLGFGPGAGGNRRWVIGEGVAVVLWAVWCSRFPVGLAYLLVTVAGSWIHPFMTSFVPHDAGQNHPLRRTRLFRGRVLELLSFGHLYHLEHHLYPQVPHQRWRELARRLDPFLVEQGVKPVILWR